MQLDELRQQIVQLDPVAHEKLRCCLQARYEKLAASRTPPANDFENTFVTRHGQTKFSCENPVTQHSAVVTQIMHVIQHYEQNSRCTWSEVINAVQRIQPKLVRAYHEAYAAADCDIYGKWNAHQMQSQDLQQFRENLRVWQNAVKQLLDCHAGFSKDKLNSIEG